MFSLETIISLIIILLAAGLLGFFTIIGKKRWRVGFRTMRPMSLLRKALGASVEEGRRIHVSIGSANILNPASAASLAGISAAEQIVQQTMVGDRSPIITSGDATLSIISRDSLKTTYAKSNALNQLRAGQSQLVGVTPWTYAAGAIAPIKDQATSGNILLGHFGPESALMLDAAEQSGSMQIAGSDNLAGQAVMYAFAQETVLGEELFAVSLIFTTGWSTESRFAGSGCVTHNPDNNSAGCCNY